MSLRLSVSSTTPCQLLSEACGVVCASAAAIEFSLTLRRCSRRNTTKSGLVEAPKLDAIFGIVNMPRRYSDLRGVAMSWECIAAFRCAIRQAKRSGREAMAGRFRMFAAALAMLAAGGNAWAQSPFPAKPVHIFVPYAAGGAVDILARTLGDAVSQKWGQSVVIENRPGAGGVIASQALVTSPPDGYTLIMVASGHPTNAFLYEKLPYDTFKDFTPITQVASSPNILLVKADSPFKTVA